LVLAGRRVVLTLVHANARIDVRWRHLARDHALPDRAGPGARFLEGDERHRRDGIRLMALLALLLEDGGDVLREGRLARSCFGPWRRAGGGARGADCRDARERDAKPRDPVPTHGASLSWSEFRRTWRIEV